MNSFICWIHKGEVKGHETEYVNVFIPCLTMAADKEINAPKTLIKGKSYYAPAESIRRHFLTCAADQSVPKTWLLMPVEGR